MFRVPIELWYKSASVLSRMEFSDWLRYTIYWKFGSARNVVGLNTSRQAIVSTAFSSSHKHSLEYNLLQLQ